MRREEKRTGGEEEMKRGCEEKRRAENKEWIKKKSRIRETKNLSTDADRRTDTILDSLRDLSRKRRRKNGSVDASTRPRTHPLF